MNAILTWHNQMGETEYGSKEIRCNALNSRRRPGTSLVTLIRTRKAPQDLRIFVLPVVGLGNLIWEDHQSISAAAAKDLLQNPGLERLDAAQVSGILVFGRI